MDGQNAEPHADGDCQLEWFRTAGVAIFWVRRASLAYTYIRLSSDLLLSSPIFTPTVTITDLPQELIDEIIGFLEEDQATLLSCSLICRDWVSTSQRLLHRHVCLDFASLRRTSVPRHTPHGARVPPPALALLTRILQVTAHDERDWEIVSRFTQITELVAKKFSWNYELPPAGGHQHFPFHHVRKLTLSQASFSNVQAFVHFLSLFPTLDVLKLVRVEWMEGSAELMQLTDSQSYRTLCTLVIGDHEEEWSSSSVAALATHWLSKTRIENFDVRVDIALRRANVMSTVLQSMGHDLRHLTLSMLHYYMGPFDGLCESNMRDRISMN